ncbi:HTH_Tnp_Tc3_2 domain-containing protein [Trichonephila clavipes]|uniref:HTH_Tnp_Tc3_2 domain-containing protein n=1 Tax=Trichonephila clavipes TaxID=2585209 RepID=A0A8X6V172_TRICX|nr:HTH_Tnp_Tc3_2 domain-containing protein [Trichonephila clavipes]
MSEWDYTNERVMFWMDLNGDFKWVCSTITSQNIYGRAPTIILLTMRPSRLFVKIRCHAVLSARKRSALKQKRLKRFARMESETLTQMVYKSKAIILDIEGTITSIDFIRENVFPYAESHLEDFIMNNWKEVREIGLLLQQQIHKRDDYPPIVGRFGKRNVLDRSECAVRNCWEQWTREGTHARKTVSGATRKTTRREDRRIVRQALVDPSVTRSTIRVDVGVAIVPQTIFRHLAEANLKSKRPFRVLPLTPEHRQLRLQWCQARSRVWRRPDEWYNPPPHTMFYVTLPAQLV